MANVGVCASTAPDLDPGTRLRHLREQLVLWVRPRAGWEERGPETGTRRDQWLIVGEGEHIALVEGRGGGSSTVYVRCGPAMPWTNLGTWKGRHNALMRARAIVLLDRRVHRRVTPGAEWWVNLDPLQGDAQVRRRVSTEHGGPGVWLNACTMTEIDGRWAVHLGDSDLIVAWEHRSNALAHLAVLGCELTLGGLERGGEIDLEQLARTKSALEGL